jgi:hypothetical protein
LGHNSIRYFTSHRPAKHAITQRPIKLEQWMRIDYPTIFKRAKAKGAKIY